MDEDGLPVPVNGQLSVSDVMGLVRLFNDSLLAMEARLGAKMDDNSQAASDRWIKHDRDSERVLADIEKRFNKMETELCKQTADIAADLKTHIAIADAHWQKEHDEEIAFDARLTPVKGAVGYLRHNWKNILLAVVTILAILGFSVSTFRNILSGLGV